MSDFQITIIAAKAGGEAVGEPASNFEINKHGGGDAVIDEIEQLEGIWDQVIKKLTGLAAKTQGAARALEYELSAIEFNLGVETGLSVGLVAKGNASVSITFARKGDASTTADGDGNSS